MKKLLVFVVSLLVITFVIWKKFEEPSFTIETRRGQTIRVTKIHFEPTTGFGKLSFAKHFYI